MPTQCQIEVYLADDHEIVAKAIANLLMPLGNIKQVSTFLNGKELYRACLAKLPDLVILDMEMPEWNGLTTLKKIKELNSNVPVIMLTMNDEKRMVEESVREGAKGYLHKNCSPEELQTALHTVMSGKLFLSDETKNIIAGLKQNAAGYPELTEPLTEKDHEVLKLVCEGLTSKEIGEKLFLSPRTVETRKNNLMQKFNVQSTGKLIAIALKHKIVK